MSTFDASGFADDLLGWNGELAARVRDLLARRSATWSEKLSSLAQRFDGALSLGALRSTLLELLSRFRAESAGAAEDPELARLFERIREHGRRESIESYSDFLFTVEIQL